MPASGQKESLFNQSPISWTMTMWISVHRALQDNFKGCPRLSHVILNDYDIGHSFDLLFLNWSRFV